MSWYKLPRRYYARVLAQSICAICVVTRPFSRFGNQYAFFAITCYELVFSPQSTLSQTFECIVLHLLGGLFGIAVSALGRYCASLAEPSSVASRAIPATFLASIAFIAGYLKSRLPRLIWSMRILIFVSVWMLTAPDDESLWKLSSNWLWVLLVASMPSLFSSVLLLSWSSPIALSAASTFSLLNEALQNNMQDIFQNENLPKQEHRRVHANLLTRSHNLIASYQVASFELRLGYVPVKALKPFLSVIEHLRQELSLLPAFFIGSLDPAIKSAFHAPAKDLAEALLQSMVAVQNIVVGCYSSSIKRGSLRSQKAALLEARSRLQISQARTRRELTDLADKLTLNATTTLEDGVFGFPTALFNLSLLMISFLHMSQELQYALRVGLKLHSMYETSPLQLFHPRWSLAWLGASPDIFVMEARGPLWDPKDDGPNRNLATIQETMQGLAEQQEDSDPACDDSEKEISPHEYQDDHAPHPIALPHRHRSLIHRMWKHPKIVRFRLWLSESLRHLQHSKHIEHALKNAVGLSILAIPIFLPKASAAYQNFTWIRGQWMLLTFIWVLETNIGSTFRVGYLRLSGTLIGAIYAYIVTLLADLNPYLIVFFLFLAELPISWIVINTDFPSLGVVAAITLPPIILGEYINPDPFISSLELTLFRGAMISTGIIAALTINSLFFPCQARVQFLDRACTTLGILNEVYIRLSRNLITHSSISMLKEKTETLKLELQVRHSIHRMHTLLATMNDELSLVPKPMRKYRNLLNILQKLQDLMAAIRKIRGHIPRQETVIDVLPERRELISCICISLFACEQVFRARQHLPQFLPSSRRAFLQLEHAIEDRLQNLHENAQMLGLGTIYSLAEMDTLREMVDSLGELSDISRDLFGTSNWYQESSLPVSQVTTIMAPTLDEMDHPPPSTPKYPARPPGPIRMPSASLFFERSEPMTPL